MTALNEDRQKRFLADGYVVENIANTEAFETFRDFITKEIEAATGTSGIDLNELSGVIPLDSVNEVRLRVYNALNRIDDVMELYFSIFRPVVETIVGTELASQNKINLGVHLSGDATSRIPLHTDTVAAQSEFEVVAWLPFTRCYDSNGIFIHSIENSQRMLAALPEYSDRGMDTLADDWQDKATFLKIDPGQCLLFSSTLMHGNVTNETPNSRISLNARFKGLFTPYTEIGHSEKKLGNFYKPFRVSPVTRLALQYEEPTDGF